MKIRIMTAALAVFFMLPFFCTTAFAVEIERTEPEAPAVVVEEPASDPVPVTGGLDPNAPPVRTSNPFTPSGTGTVTDYATDADGKVFYTIMTPDEHVFYLVIDRQRGAENVYFLNAVTVADLMALAEIPAPPQGGTVTPPPPASTTEPPAEETPAPPEQTGGNTGMYIFIAAVVILGGGAGWYFKIYRPKQQGAASGEEYEPPVDNDENDYSDDWGDEQDESGDSPPWDEGESE